MAEAAARRLRFPVFGLTIAVLAISGLGQMPIFKRYYVADTPGLGWTADFLITHHLHYIAAAVFLFILAFRLTTRPRTRPTPSALVLAALLSLTALTGLALAVKNLPGVLLPPALITFLNISHLALAFSLAPAAIAVWRGRRKRRKM